MTLDEIDRRIEAVGAIMDYHQAEMAWLSRERAELIYAQREAKAGSTPRLRVAGGVG
jgi:hypothetical protein